MKWTLVLIVQLVFGSSEKFTKDENNAPTIIKRNQWNARAPKAIENMTNPVEYVIIHHSYLPPACYTSAKCKRAMRSMQDFHMDDREWNDIGYSFAAGGDGLVYEGRGWSRVGAHAPKYNNRSIGICTIGDWTRELPPKNQIKAVRDLIKLGVTMGMISSNYKLLGHRQTRPTECPGEAYYGEIKTWPHWDPIPVVV